MNRLTFVLTNCYRIFYSREVYVYVRINRKQYNLYKINE